ncbi:phospholipid/glycerol acyltransferase [Enterobacter cancerogenus]|uniref:L-ornithine N(alpha)-acyltransferase n=1 Tax=Enterobacter cancerogenus TaxID=69218 RepID=A0A484XJV2_9ENTR|nr:phospholipid/glycerol acyltransferase [Enterobacter cancerogenus]
MFSLDSVLDNLWPQARPAPWQKNLLKKLLYEEEFQQFAADHRHLKGLDMVEQVLEHLDIHCTVSARDLEQIPDHGPLVIIANHPTGTLDGLALMYAVSRVRRDVKVVTNRLLTHLEPLGSLFIPVDNINGRTSKSSLMQMEQHLHNGGVLIFFPAGEVSRPTRKGIRDKKWHSGFIKLAGKLRAPLLPMHIQARNSLFFYASTLVSPTLSMLLLMQQMFRRRHSTLPITIGQQIAWSQWFSAGLSSREMAERCRQHVMRLGKGVPGVFKTQCAIARAEDRATLKRALAQAECLGKTSDGKTVYLWQRNGQEEAPILRELGRLREIAFRAVDEGSGKRRDTDRYDDDYLHLILWDDDDLEIVGAYRFMPTAMQIAQRGVEGLYSHSLFHYDQQMEEGAGARHRTGAQLYPAALLGDGVAWITCGRALVPIWHVIRTTVIFSGRSLFLAGCRPPRGICWWRFTGSGFRQAPARRLAPALSRASLPDVLAQFWRRGLRRGSDQAEIPARQPRVRHSPALQTVFRAVRARRRAVYRFRQRSGVQSLR